MGEIIKRDVENYTPSGTKSMLGSNAVTKESYEEVLSDAQSLLLADFESKFSAPAFLFNHGN